MRGARASSESTALNSSCSGGSVATHAPASRSCELRREGHSLRRGEGLPVGCRVDARRRSGRGATRSRAGSCGPAGLSSRNWSENGVRIRCVLRGEQSTSEFGRELAGDRGRHWSGPSARTGCLVRLLRRPSLPATRNRCHARMSGHKTYNQDNLSVIETRHAHLGDPASRTGRQHRPHPPPSPGDRTLRVPHRAPCRCRRAADPSARITSRPTAAKFRLGTVTEHLMLSGSDEPQRGARTRMSTSLLRRHRIPARSRSRLWSEHEPLAVVHFPVEYRQQPFALAARCLRERQATASSADDGQSSPFYPRNCDVERISYQMRATAH